MVQVGQYNINSNAPRTNMEIFQSRDFFGFGMAVSKENADLARRRRIFGVFFRQQKTPSKTENAVLYIKYVIKVQ